MSRQAEIWFKIEKCKSLTDDKFCGKFINSYGWSSLEYCLTIDLFKEYEKHGKQINVCQEIIAIPSIESAQAYLDKRYLKNKRFKWISIEYDESSGWHIYAGKDLKK